MVSILAYVDGRPCSYGTAGTNQGREGGRKGGRGGRTKRKGGELADGKVNSLSALFGRGHILTRTPSLPPSPSSPSFKLLFITHSYPRRRQAHRFPRSAATSPRPSRPPHALRRVPPHLPRAKRPRRSSSFPPSLFPSSCSPSTGSSIQASHDHAFSQPSLPSSPDTDLPPKGSFLPLAVCVCLSLFLVLVLSLLRAPRGTAAESHDH